MPYAALRPLFFQLDPEFAHDVGMCGIRLLHALNIFHCLKKPAAVPQNVMGLSFPNPVGLAAGLDKNGDCIDALAAMGFGFVEIGTVTPRAQGGNPKPRLFRLPTTNAIINRMGFNNRGVDDLLAKVKASHFQKTGGILGINIGKNADTPIDKAADDYVLCLEKVYAAASYVAVNISSPNTKNLRELQQDAALDALLSQIKIAQTALSDQHGRYVPIALKIAPDLEPAQIQTIADALRRHHFDGVIATNTTLSREGVSHLPEAAETGGLSGAPLRARSNQVLAELATALAGEVPIIGVGGILKGEDAAEKIRLGASLVQIYSGIIFAGPALIKEAVDAIRAGAPSTKNTLP